MTDVGAPVDPGGTKTVALGRLAELCGAELRGDRDRLVRGVRSLEHAGAEHLSFLTSGSYLPLARSSEAGALLVGPDHADDLTGRDLLVIDDPYRALAHLLHELYPTARRIPGVHPTAVVDPSASVAASATIGPYCVVGADAVIDDEVWLESFVSVGSACVVGRGSILHAHTALYARTTLGQAVVVHAGTVLGADGFGFAEQGGLPVKLPQVGRVVVGDRVEVGANSAIDRATLEETVIGHDTKIDNLVQIGHNVEVGAGSILCGQAGIAGSAKLGRGVVMAGQAGSAGHLRIGDGARVAAQGAVLSDVEDGETVGGSPAIPFRRWRRAVAVFARLDELKKRVRLLEKALERLEDDRVGD